MVSRIPVLLMLLAGALSAASAQFTDRPLSGTITGVQPMTGIVLWTDHENNTTDAVQLEYSYMLYDQVVSTQGNYNWTDVDNLLNAVAGRGHQAILRFRFVYPGYATSVPAYIKALPGYNETHGTSEGESTWFPDWTSTDLQVFTLEFYTKFAERYDDDQRLAFIQTGFGLWGEYHIYDGPFVLGTTFPSKAFQETFFRHLDTTFTNLPWSISIDAADDAYSPFSAVADLRDIGFGLFDDSFMHEEHADYNTDCWNFFDRSRYLRAPAGGEFSYYTDYDQQHVLDAAGIYGVTFEQAAAAFHISYMIGNDQPSYQSLARIRETGMASGYRFIVTAFRASADSSVVTIKNTGVAPFYYDAYVTVNGTRSGESLKNLGPDSSLVCHIGSGGTSPVLTIESDRLVAGQVIEYEADLAGAGIEDMTVPEMNIPHVRKYYLDGRKIRRKRIPSGIYLLVTESADGYVSIAKKVVGIRTP